MHAVRETWVLTFRPDDGPDLRFILCPDCGEQRRPVLAVVDREKLAPEDGLDDVRKHADAIAEARGTADERYLPIRDADLHQFAAIRHLKLGEFLEGLEARGVLRTRR